jgi:glucan phosphorylase
MYIEHSNCKEHFSDQLQIQIQLDQDERKYKQSDSSILKEKTADYKDLSEMSIAAKNPSWTSLRRYASVSAGIVLVYAYLQVVFIRRFRHFTRDRLTSF